MIVDQGATLQATIVGFSGDGSLANSDQIDLKDINFGSLSDSYDSVHNVLDLSDGTHTAAIHFVGSCVEENFHFVSDGNGGTIVVDPPVPSDNAGSGGLLAMETNGFSFKSTTPSDPAHNYTAPGWSNSVAPERVSWDAPYVDNAAHELALGGMPGHAIGQLSHDYHLV